MPMRKVYSKWDAVHQPAWSKKYFVRGLIFGICATLLVCALLFFLLGPLAFGKREEETSVSPAESSVSEESSEPVSAEPSSALPDERSSEVESKSEIPSVVSTSSTAVSKAASKANVEILDVPSPLNQKSPVYLVAGDLQDESYLESSVFIGDSITQGMGLYLPDLNTVVLGVRSLNPDSVFTATAKLPGGGSAVIPKVAAAYKPKRVFIMIGTNGIAWMSQDHMISQIEKLINQLRSSIPGVTIIIESIPPVSYSKYQSNKRFSVKAIDSYNTKLLALAENLKASFLDVNSFFRNKNGYIPENETPDGIHFYKANYVKWVNQILCHTETYAQVQSKEEITSKEESEQTSLPVESSLPESNTSIQS